MFLIVILFFVILVIFGIYKLCVYLNNDNDSKKKKINNIILKICLSGVLVLLILLLYNGVEGFLNGSERFFCNSDTISDCYDYGFDGFFQKIIQKFYWGIPILFIFLLYIIIYKVNYKRKIITNKSLFLTITIIVVLVSFFPLYKTIFNKIYFSFTDYKYEIIIKGADYNDYFIYVYDKKINVIKKEQVICFAAPCDSIYNGEYEINFSNDSMIEIFNYIDNSFSNKNISSRIIMFNNIENIDELNIIKSIIFNDETYIK